MNHATTVPLRFVTGDATEPQPVRVPVEPMVIAHICNDAGRWGAGFVMAVSKKWWQPEINYRSWYLGRSGNDFHLGAVRVVPVQSGLWVANMIGQHGTFPDTPRPISYPAVWHSLSTLGTWALTHGASVHMPRIGCGLAGGSWDRIGPLVDETLCQRGVAVTVYDFPGDAVT